MDDWIMAFIYIQSIVLERLMPDGAGRTGWTATM